MAEPTRSIDRAYADLRALRAQYDALRALNAATQEKINRAVRELDTLMTLADSMPVATRIKALQKMLRS